MSPGAAQTLKVAVNQSRCIACAGCVGVCPVDTITLKEIVLTIEQGPCISCGLCIQMCPVGALTPAEGYGSAPGPRPSRVLVVP
jgi:L-aspartate semialdehyde sulfurtransferase ferredoxin